MNDDGVIHDEDVNIANNYIGESVWEDIILQVVVEDNLVARAKFVNAYTPEQLRQLKHGRVQTFQDPSRVP